MRKLLILALLLAEATALYIVVGALALSEVLPRWTVLTLFAAFPHGLALMFVLMEIWSNARDD